MRAIGIVLAGGNNRRMRELSHKRAVCAMPIAGSYRSIDFTLSNMSNSHIQSVAVFTQYTNGSDKTAIPADNVTVKAFQNGIELSPLVPTGEKTENYSQCDASVQSGVTADIVWFFQLDDDSTVSVELSGGEKVDVELTK